MGNESSRKCTKCHRTRTGCSRQLFDDSKRRWCTACEEFTEDCPPHISEFVGVKITYICVGCDHTMTEVETSGGAFKCDKCGAWTPFTISDGEILKTPYTSADGGSMPDSEQRLNTLADRWRYMSASVDVPHLRWKYGKVRVSPEDNEVTVIVTDRFELKIPYDLLFELMRDESLMNWVVSDPTGTNRARERALR